MSKYIQPLNASQNEAFFMPFFEQKQQTTKQPKNTDFLIEGGHLGGHLGGQKPYKNNIIKIRLLIYYFSKNNFSKF